MVSSAGGLRSRIAGIMRPTTPGRFLVRTAAEDRARRVGGDYPVRLVHYLARSSGSPGARRRRGRRVPPVSGGVEKFSAIYRDQVHDR